MANNMLQTLLKDEQKKRQLSSRQMAEEVGVAHTTIIRAMRGDPMDLETIIAFADWLHVRPSELVNSFSKGKVPDLTNDLALLLERIPGLAKPLAEATQAVKDGTADPAIIDDIVNYATYKLARSGVSNAPRKRKA
jgi:transcriptional regulator with XRE-family HTH domain